MPEFLTIFGKINQINYDDANTKTEMSLEIVIEHTRSVFEL